MTDVTFALEAKSDQLNAVDLMASHRTIKIRKVDVKKGDQPISVFFDGDNNKPWKPCKGMSRILASAWGKDSDNWIGKHAEIYLDHDVVWAGKPVGGVRIKALSDIDQSGITVPVTISRQVRIRYSVDFLTVNVERYPADQFDKAFPAMVAKMTSGEMNLQVVIARCQQTGTLSPDQLKRLEDAAPVDEDETIDTPEPEPDVDPDPETEAEAEAKAEPEDDGEEPVEPEDENPIDPSFVLKSSMGDEKTFESIDSWKDAAMMMIGKASGNKQAIDGFRKRHGSILAEISAEYPEVAEAVEDALKEAMTATE